MKSFYDKVITSEHGCWDWIGASSGRYGMMRFMGKNLGAHVVSYILHHGEVTKSMYVLHTCDNGLCVNPKHLFLGTQLDNMRDKVNKNRQARGTTIGGAVLDENDVRNVHGMLLQGYQLKEIATVYAVHTKTIALIRDGVTWRHLDV